MSPFRINACVARRVLKRSSRFAEQGAWGVGSVLSLVSLAAFLPGCAPAAGKVVHSHVGAGGRSSPPPYSTRLRPRTSTGKHAMYTILDLGVLPHYKEADADAINNNGVVIGHVRGRYYDYWQAFVWQNGVQTDLGTFGGPTCTATGLNDAGQIVGVSETDDNGGHPGTHAFLWQNGHLRDLGEFGLDGINARGQAVGSRQAGRHERTIIWENGQIRDITVLLPGSHQEPIAINDSGQIAGNYRVGKRGQRVFFFNGRASYTLPSLGGSFSRANGMNNRGAIVGVSGIERGEYGAAHACLWQNRRACDLDAWHTAYSYARGLNDSGQVVGGYEDPKQDNRAALWENGRMIDLNTQISPNSGWILDTATSINNRGQIVGIGLLRGQRRGFLLTPTNNKPP